MHTALWVSLVVLKRAELYQKRCKENTFTSSCSLNQLPGRKVILGNRSVHRKWRAYARHMYRDIIDFHETSRDPTKWSFQKFFFLPVAKLHFIEATIFIKLLLPSNLFPMILLFLSHVLHYFRAGESFNELATVNHDPSVPLFISQAKCRRIYGVENVLAIILASAETDLHSRSIFVLRWMKIFEHTEYSTSSVST